MIRARPARPTVTDPGVHAGDGPGAHEQQAAPLGDNDTTNNDNDIIITIIIIIVIIICICFVIIIMIISCIIISSIIVMIICCTLGMDRAPENSRPPHRGKPLGLVYSPAGLSRGVCVCVCVCVSVCVRACMQLSISVLVWCPTTQPASAL